MIGRTPPHIEVMRPLESGVVSHYGMTETMLKFLLKRIGSQALLKPRLAICIPGEITGVESQAVVKAAVTAGARDVYLIEQPVAAAIGAGMDISKPIGNMVVDIGGGSSDIAVMSMNGIVCKSSIRVAGGEFDAAVIKHVRLRHNLMIGEKTAEEIKKQIGSVAEKGENYFMDAKGRDLISGLPKKVRISRNEIKYALQDVADEITRAVQLVLERTPPELIGDIYQSGMLLTGGSALLDGIGEFLEKNTKVRTVIAKKPMDCVAIGTAKSFSSLDELLDGVIHTPTHRH
jgi:rod shape-determining protein MreB